MSYYAIKCFILSPGKENVNHSFFGSNVWVAGSIEKRLDIDIPQTKVKKVTVE